MNSYQKHFTQYIDNIKKSGLTIYDSIKVNDPDLWIPTLDLEELLDNKIKGISLAGLPLRTRSKIVKEEICQALGYPIPRSFKKVQPRFLGQLFDTYVQKSNNLQIWNEDLSLNRRYVLIRVNKYDEIIKVKVVTGDVMVKLDTTGTLTQKYQAKLILNENSMELISDSDTDLLSCFVNDEVNLAAGVLPTFDPQEQQILPIKNIMVLQE